MIVRVILAMHDAGLQKRLAKALSRPGLLVESLVEKGHAWDNVLRRNGDVIVISQSLIPEPIEGSVYLLNQLPDTPTTVVVSESDSPDEHARLLAASCDTVLYAGLPERRLIDAIEATIETRQQLLRHDLGGRRVVSKPQLSDFVSESTTMRMFMQLVERVVPSNSSLMILGETGVGKERLARAIHAESPRSSGPFVAVNCAALPEQLLESELFGHEEGSFTGATRSRRGAFEMADGGTIFLDEIGELPLHLQAKLLRVLQDYEVRPVGSEKAFEVDVRVMAASNRDLTAEMDQGRFRRDLYYRLGVVTLTVPPLRERREDIPALVQDYIDYLRPKIGREVYTIREGALTALCNYDWPGNVRELLNIVERAMLLCEGDEITVDSLPAGVQETGSASPEAQLVPDQAPAAWKALTLGQVMENILPRVEKAYLQMILEETAGKVGEAAKRAGIHQRGLYNKMRTYGLRKEDFRQGGQA
ncbi:MAG: sigma-54 dependent transcriptional regulator [Planctomycetota bacterium]|nr:sigma-54 dependent transcriptional regulator [Planctomycetota bacterium]